MAVADLGEPGERPESYWSPRLADVCHLRPGDLADLTFVQLHSAYMYAHPDD